jgi:hypothetical protein
MLMNPIGFGRTVYRYRFEPLVEMADIEASIVLAVFAAESLHGETQVRLDAAHFLDAERRALVIDAATPVGRDLNRLFAGFLRREYGEESFTVQRISETPSATEPSPSASPSVAAA